jgi:MFS family permease
MARLFPNTGTFRSLANYNYRLWAGGALVSNVGTWMQRVAQDWLVLTQLTDNSASTVGAVMALQFGPQMLMLPWSGFAADFFDRRKLLMVTQARWASAPWGSACSPSPAWSSSGMSTCLPSCMAVPRRSTRRHGRLSFRIWWARPTCRMPWRSTPPRSTPRA